MIRSNFSIENVQLHNFRFNFFTLNLAGDVKKSPPYNAQESKQFTAFCLFFNLSSLTRSSFKCSCQLKNNKNKMKFARKIGVKWYTMEFVHFLPNWCVAMRFFVFLRLPTRFFDLAIKIMRILSLSLPHFLFFPSSWF